MKPGSLRYGYQLRRPPVEFDQARMDRYLEHLRDTGSKSLSADLVGVTSGTVANVRSRDRAFAEAESEAKEWWVDHVLVAEAVRRATKGNEVPIIGGKFKDQIITTVQEYSDTLMVQLLRANRREFRDGPGQGETGEATSGVLVVPGAPTSPRLWESMMGAHASFGHKPDQGALEPAQASQDQIRAADSSPAPQKPVRKPGRRKGA